MWPFDRASTRDIVRIGRLAVERWEPRRGALAALGREPLAEPSTPAIAAALRALYPQPPPRAITLLLETAWLPLLLADTGGALWSRAQIETLLRHRLAALYGDDAEPPSSWPLRIDHRPGDRFARGGALPPRLQRSLLDSARVLGLRWHALLPAFDWGWQRRRPVRQPAGRTGWWLWPEQDRLLIARIEAGRLTALEAAAPPAGTPAARAAQVELARRRLGIGSGGDPIVAGAFS
ncbi:hypothetical protein HLB44_17945 [Aquincola sp. S2]|uniref:Uncharacterized protein n=1 Tax=Pseudaquabacterium terrae TaxID=2732868 RepID=A0ABX2EJU0_9BURK|nr:hypothetical protein [Aquabacterium terrae]NRF68879.1 hypothetical protein [Aquabacterium terrae]